MHPTRCFYVVLSKIRLQRVGDETPKSPIRCYLPFAWTCTFKRVKKKQKIKNQLRIVFRKAEIPNAFPEDLCAQSPSLLPESPAAESDCGSVICIALYFTRLSLQNPFPIRVVYVCLVLTIWIWFWRVEKPKSETLSSRIFARNPRRCYPNRPRPNPTPEVSPSLEPVFGGGGGGGGGHRFVESKTDSNSDFLDIDALDGGGLCLLHIVPGLYFAEVSIWGTLGWF